MWRRARSLFGRPVSFEERTAGRAWIGVVCSDVVRGSAIAYEPIVLTGIEEADIEVESSLSVCLVLCLVRRIDEVWSMMVGINFSVQVHYCRLDTFNHLPPSMESEGVTATYAVNHAYFQLEMSSKLCISRARVTPCCLNGVFGSEFYPGLGNPRVGFDD